MRLHLGPLPGRSASASGPLGNQPSKCRPARSRLAGSAAARSRSAARPGDAASGQHAAFTVQRPSQSPACRSTARGTAACPRACRPTRFSNGTPRRRTRRGCWARREAMPTPRITRPSDIWSSVATCCASTHRVAQRRQQHGGAELDARHAGGHGGQQGQRIVARPRQQRIADPDRIEAERLGALGQRQQRQRPPAALP